MAQVKLGDVALVEWQDHYSKNSGWVPTNDATKLADQRYVCKSIGLVVSSNDDQVVLAQQWHAVEGFEPAAADFMVIMKKNIIKSTIVIKQELKYRKIK